MSRNERGGGEITEHELALVMNRTKIFAAINDGEQNLDEKVTAGEIPLEGCMYDIVTVSSEGTLGGVGY